MLQWRQWQGRLLMPLTCGEKREKESEQRAKGPDGGRGRQKYLQKRASNWCESFQLKKV